MKVVRVIKKLGVVLAMATALVVFVGVVLATPWVAFPPQVQGVTFSEPHATGIGLNWKEAYNAILEDLDVNYLRLSAYWNEVEPSDDEFDFEILDYQMDRAAEEGAKVILGVGRKLPRWPECHTPEWAVELSEKEQQEKVLEMLPVVIERYKDHPALLRWQLENEPLLDFGICPAEDRAFLTREENILRSLDGNHPILITDSGELNFWWDASGFGDELGTTMYRTVFSDRTQKHFHYDYLFPSWGYRLKARYVKWLRGKDVIISELQGEPWGTKSFPEMTKEEREKSISPQRFKDLHQFAKRTGLPETYWWGVEYWYWEKVVNDEPVFWETARGYF